MKHVLFKKAGNYAICGGTEGVLTVEKDGDVHRVSDNAASIWIDDGVAVIAELNKNGSNVKDVIPEVEAPIIVENADVEADEGDVLPEVEIEAPKKRGRKKKAD